MTQIEPRAAGVTSRSIVGDKISSYSSTQLSLQTNRRVIRIELALLLVGRRQTPDGCVPSFEPNETTTGSEVNGPLRSKPCARPAVTRAHQNEHRVFVALRRPSRPLRARPARSSALAGKSRARSRPRPGGRSRLVHGRSTLLAVTAPHAEITGRALAQPRGRPPRRDQAPYSDGVGELHAFCPERAKREFAPGRARIEPRGTGDGSVRHPEGDDRGRPRRLAARARPARRPVVADRLRRRARRLVGLPPAGRPRLRMRWRKTPGRPALSAPTDLR